MSQGASCRVMPRHAMRTRRLHPVGVRSAFGRHRASSLGDVSRSTYAEESVARRAGARREDMQSNIHANNTAKCGSHLGINPCDGRINGRRIFPFYSAETNEDAH